MHAATSILHRANEAVAKEQRLSAVSELQSRVEDWKGHQIDHFGDLMLFGSFTVLKGEGAKEVEREVREIFFSLSPKCRKRIRRMSGPDWILSHMLSPKRSPLPLDWRRDSMVPEVPDSANCTSPRTNTAGLMDANAMGLAHWTQTGLRSPVVPTPKRFVSGLEGVPEEVHEQRPEEMPKEGSLNDTSVKPANPKEDLVGAVPPKARRRPSKPLFYTKSLLGHSPSPLQSPSFAPLKTLSLASPLSPHPPTREGSGNEGGSAPPTPSRSSRGAGSGKLAEFGIKMRASGRTVKSAFIKTQPIQATDVATYSQLYLFNGALKHGTQFLTPRMGHLPLPTPGPVGRVDSSAMLKPTSFERDVIEELKLTRPVRIQYKVYLFERILLCCKEINPNKPKNKMLGNNKPLVDKKGKLRLQLKGRIFMQNVTDVISVVKSGKQLREPIRIRYRS